MCQASGSQRRRGEKSFATKWNCSGIYLPVLVHYDLTHVRRYPTESSRVAHLWQESAQPPFLGNIRALTSKRNQPLKVVARMRLLKLWLQPKDTEAMGREILPSGRSLEDHFFAEGNSAAMRALQRLIADIAPTDIPVLLVGESGTGKEVLALWIHRLSERRNRPFTKLVCGELAADSFNDQFDSARTGEGNGSVLDAGTVFLDEMSELDLACQPKLLHALPDGGLSREHCLGPRVISATNRNLEEEVRSGRFREDLYYRLNGVCLRLPPLHSRKEDIPALVDFFLNKYAGQFGRPKPSLSVHTLSILVDYSWPGNIRELESAVKKIVAVGDEQLALADLASPISESQLHNSAAGRPSLKQASRAASRQAERELILQALSRTRWNRKRAAKDLQISYKALLYKLKQMRSDDSANS